MSPLEAPRVLPSPLRSVLDWLFFSVLSADDDFTQILRKVSSAFLLLVSPVPIGFAVYYATRAANGAPKYGAAVEPAFGILVGITFVVSFAVVKHKRHMSHLHAEVLFINLVLNWTMVYLSVPDFDPRTTMGAIAIACTLAQPPHLIPFLGYLFVLSAISVYNQVYRDSGLPLLLIPGPIRPVNETEDLLIQLSAMFCLALAICGVVAQAAAHVRALAASEAGVRMSNEVVVLLSDYNTDGVDEVLSSYAAEGEVNSKLIDSFRGINHNLELYRPHLPNYVLMKDEDATGGEEPVSHSQSKVLSRQSTASGSASSVTDGLHPGRRSEVALGNSLLGFRGRISFARVDLRGLLKGGALLRETSTAFFEFLFQLATTFHASLHATVGDIATLSWNATRRVAQPELKAAKFLLRLLSAVRSIPSARPAAGAVFSGLAVCDVVKAQAARQQAVLISAPWVEALDAAFRLAQSARCGLIDTDTHATASYELEARAVERVQYVPRDEATEEAEAPNAWLTFDPKPRGPGVPETARSTVLYELVSEVQRSDDEWMYQLQTTATQQTSSAKVTQAFESAVAGQYGIAMSLLNDVCLGIGSGPEENGVLVQRMKDRCEQILMSIQPP